MNQRERFRAIMSNREYDRLPVWFFGTWWETKDRWLSEGLSDMAYIAEETGMDPDWENGMWNVHAMVQPGPRSSASRELIEENDTYRLVRTPLGAVVKQNKANSSIPQHLEHALKPTRKSWAAFRSYLDPYDSKRYDTNWKEKADALNNSDRVATFMAGSLFGWAREWMGVEEWGCMAYTDPVLFEEIIDYLTEYFITLYRPLLQKADFDFAYFFEDCCFNTGPLFSPDVYRMYFDKYYRKLIDFYRSMGIPFILMDSDGKVDQLLPCWLASGFDIVFPIEVGTWNADPRKLRKHFGKRLRMMGGIDKHSMLQDESTIRRYLSSFKPLVDEGGYIPLPDHRIPPSCSFEQFKTYIRIFKEVFNGE